MLKKSLLVLILCCSSLVFAASCFSQTCSTDSIFKPDGGFVRQWDLMLYYGKTTKNTLGQVVGGNIDLDKERLYSIEFGRVNPPCGRVNQYFGHFFGRTEFLLNLTIHDDQLGVGTIYETIFYIRAHWTRFPWNNYVYTTLALGEGISYVTDIPVREWRESDDPKKLLNYLSFEVSVALPCFKECELVFRIHHRSGVFGLYNANNSGATAVGIGLRYYL